jgi:UDP-N-acetylglucosamine:LPS N-acetylglucosamine transferase
MPLRPWWGESRRTWVTFETQDAQSLLRAEDVVWAHHPTTRNLPNLVRNFRLAVTELRRSRPDLVISTGAGVAVPFFLVAKLMHIPTVYIEVYDRIETPTLTARLCRPLTSLFCVQWEEQRALYRDAHVIGTLL